jgi:hypothetical protein
MIKSGTPQNEGQLLIIQLWKYNPEKLNVTLPQREEFHSRIGIIQSETVKPKLLSPKDLTELV